MTDFNPEPGEIEDTIWSMQEYIIQTLRIPDAGEFQMNGKGEIYLKGNEVRIQHESVLLEIVDYNEEKGEPVYNESGEREGGDKLLFTI
ncbi:hypothetical protein [Chitinophaga varians]|uniref:hypothetical protein n=1 Tax=Chitinophaga varians TaxID=2202339 RepID=UPI00165FA6E1|nr:hypothetical protein [Chitinophaga varians]MBC9908935.1 hypothetical protein [Chitinophaga varians]